MPDCQPGIEFYEDGDLIFPTGICLTPEGEINSCMEFGICPKCGSRHFGNFGFPELGDRADRNTSKNNCQCHTDDENEELLKTYGRVQQLYGGDG